MESYIRSDLACETTLKDRGQMAGVEESEHRAGRFTISRMRICTEEAARSLERPRGRYITVECGMRMDLLVREERRVLEHLLCGELRAMTSSLTGKASGKGMSVFVAGLGNAELTADALGPQTVRGLIATRHLQRHVAHLYETTECAALSALAPGVLGQTGIETLELLKSVTKTVCPDLVVVIDALAARSCERLAATVQLSDAGIAPGSGVGNHRASITQETLGVPVIALGVPTVVSSATLVFDVLQAAGITERDDHLEKILSGGKSFFVSPKESDVICSCTAEILAGAIGLAFTKEMLEI